jgi:CDP-paratose 2-epimerase
MEMRIKMSKVLITGVAGFLGTHVAEYFKRNGWDVIGIDNLTDYELTRAGFDIKKSREHNLKFLESIGVEFNKMDCRTVKYEDFEGSLSRGDKPDFIIHCAAQPAMTIAIEDPNYDADNNIWSCLNMLNIAKKLDIPMVNCSSIHVYGNDIDKEGLIEEETRFAKVPSEINEEHPVLKGELTPLHASKFTTELYTRTFQETYGVKTATFRITGMYGERQFGGMDHGWVANFVIRSVMGREITIFGTDKQVRDILHGEDVARAFMMWYNAGCPPGIYNLGEGF